MRPRVLPALAGNSLQPGSVPANSLCISARALKSAREGACASENENERTFTSISRESDIDWDSGDLGFGSFPGNEYPKRLGQEVVAPRSKP